MVRYRNYQTVKYGHFAEFLEISEELNAVIKQRGLTPLVAWVPTVGTANQIVFESEYPDLTAYQRESEKIYTDAECMKLIRRESELVVQDSVRDELWEAAPHLA